MIGYIPNVAIELIQNPIRSRIWVCVTSKQDPGIIADIPSDITAVQSYNMENGNVPKRNEVRWYSCSDPAVIPRI